MINLHPCQPPCFSKRDGSGVKIKTYIEDARGVVNANKLAMNRNSSTAK